MENGEWSLEPEGEAEVLDIIIVSDAVEGTPVAKAVREQVAAELSRRGREMLNEDEEIKSPKRNVIRVESEETHDYVKEGREYGKGRGRKDFRTEGGERSAKALVSL